MITNSEPKQHKFHCRPSSHTIFIDTNYHSKTANHKADINICIFSVRNILSSGSDDDGIDGITGGKMGVKRALERDKLKDDRVGI